jgi:N-acetylmuramoyl-L-alanine amidase
MPSFSADSPLAAEVVSSPNHGERRMPRVDLLLLHYTGMPDANEALRRLCDPASAVSAHYFVFEDGRIVQCVSELRRAWHAGEAYWNGDSDINSRSIGVEVANPGHDGGYPDFPSAQIDTVIALCSDVIARRSIPAERVLAHSDVAPGRKKDPGEKFPWGRLHQRGIGLWVEPRPIEAGPVLAIGASGPAVRELQSNLAAYGYRIAAGGHYDGATTEVVTAFQRHFRPARIDGIADLSTQKTLRDLLALRSRLAAGARVV